jgi:hypothetical protein
MSGAVHRPEVGHPAVLERELVESARRRVAQSGIEGAVYVTPAEVCALVGWVERLEAALEPVPEDIVVLPVLGRIS